jgi:hypothetical protein
MGQVASATAERVVPHPSPDVGGVCLPTGHPPTCTEEVWIPPVSVWLEEEMDEGGWPLDEPDWSGPAPDQGPNLGSHESDFF